MRIMLLKICSFIHNSSFEHEFTRWMYAFSYYFGLGDLAMGRTNILIVVKTYPEISRKYTETVCTAGVLADNKTFVRLVSYSLSIS